MCTYLLKAGRAPYVQYLLLESGGGPSQAPDPLEDSVLGMPGKLGVAHQDHVSDLLCHLSLCTLRDFTHSARLNSKSL